MISQQSLLMA